MCVTRSSADGEFLLRNNALDKERICAIETGGCPHAAIREDISANLQAAEEMTAKVSPEFLLIESGDLAYSRVVS